MRVNKCTYFIKQFPRYSPVSRFQRMCEVGEIIDVLKEKADPVDLYGLGQLTQARRREKINLLDLKAKLDEIVSNNDDEFRSYPLGGDENRKVYWYKAAVKPVMVCENSGVGGPIRRTPLKSRYKAKPLVPIGSGQVPSGPYKTPVKRVVPRFVCKTPVQEKREKLLKLKAKNIPSFDKAEMSRLEILKDKWILATQNALHALKKHAPQEMTMHQLVTTIGIEPSACRYNLETDDFE